MRILVVEDDENIAIFFREVLEGEGFGVEVARDGVEGLEKLKLNGYEVIITNGQMPRMNGEEFYLQVKNLNQALADKVIFVTGVITDFIISTGNKYIQKPVSPEQLIETVRELIP